MTSMISLLFKSRNFIGSLGRIRSGRTFFNGSVIESEPVVITGFWVTGELHKAGRVMANIFNYFAFRVSFDSIASSTWNKRCTMIVIMESVTVRVGSWMSFRLLSEQQGSSSPKVVPKKSLRESISSKMPRRTDKVLSIDKLAYSELINYFELINCSELITTLNR